MRTRWLRQSLCAFLMLFTHTADAMRLSASTLFIDLPQRHQSLTIINDQSDAIEVSLSVVTWPLPGLPAGGAAHALVVPYPARAILPPQGEQVFRLAYQGDRLDRPLAFRVVSRQRTVGAEAPPGVEVSDVAFGVGGSFPLFINPEGSKPDIQVTRTGTSQLRLHNRGGGVAFVSTLQGSQRGQRPTSLFVLPGLSRDLSLPADDAILSLKVERQGWIDIPAR